MKLFTFIRNYLHTSRLIRERREAKQQLTTAIVQLYDAPVNYRRAVEAAKKIGLLASVCAGVALSSCNTISEPQADEKIEPSRTRWAIGIIRPNEPDTIAVEDGLR